MDIAQYKPLATIMHLVIEYSLEKMAAIRGYLLKIAMAVEQEEFSAPSRTPARRNSVPTGMGPSRSG